MSEDGEISVVSGTLVTIYYKFSKLIPWQLQIGALAVTSPMQPLTEGQTLPFQTESRCELGNGNVIIDHGGIFQGIFPG